MVIAMNVRQIIIVSRHSFASMSYSPPNRRHRIMMEQQPIVILFVIMHSRRDNVHPSPSSPSKLPVA